MAAGGKTVSDQDAWLWFADESGQVLRSPKARTWSRRGHTLRITVRAGGSGRISLADLVCHSPGQHIRLILRMLVHHGRKGERKGLREKDYFAALLDAAHQQLGGPVVLVWDNYPHHVDATMRELIEARKRLTDFRFPSYTPGLNPAEGVGTSGEQPGQPRCVQPRRAGRTARTRLNRMRYQHGLHDGFIAETGLRPAPS
ncbi:hypothetical protein GCM10011578_087520 [Streptomyces fuscichromogenes]|uniref:Tc1-like transposase DDE domain-containing protein n=1 Tax=Streptomyces fuscichromogenes TaxID=1324013 RepID=A0A917XMN2_9ACTN|nr:transposase [Streptomyces fuscichromogenes]GGN40245.1 hypothetical protein GCM10011578_087520 [Streptomyces fuscichromogenes]